MIKLVRTILTCMTAGLLVCGVIALMSDLPKWAALGVMGILVLTAFSFMIKTTN